MVRSARARERGGAETARQGHSVRVRGNKAQGRNVGRSAHASPRGNRGRQMRHEAKNDEGVASREEEQDGVRRRRKCWNARVPGRLIAKSGRVETLREKASGTCVQSQSGAENCLSYDESERRVYIGSSSSVAMARAACFEKHAIT